MTAGCSHIKLPLKVAPLFVNFIFSKAVFSHGINKGIIKPCFLILLCFVFTPANPTLFAPTTTTAATNHYLRDKKTLWQALINVLKQFGSTTNGNRAADCPAGSLVCLLHPESG